MERLHPTPSKEISPVRGVNQPGEISQPPGTILSESGASSNLQHQLDQLFVQSPPKDTGLREKTVRQHTDLGDVIFTEQHPHIVV